jgi:ribonucleotide reductase alpha subunit
MKENANYSKFAGGTATSFSSVRAQGSKIKSTGGKAGGPVPYIKILNDVLNGFDQSGKRKGSGAVYIEPWHADIEAFLDLRQPGDERLRAHDVFPALWVPDLFMVRVENRETWSLFDPAKVPHLATLYGEEFETAYDQAEQSKLFDKQIDAFTLWKKILQRLSEEGVNWICFKDPSNARYVLKDIGFVASSNLCLVGDTIITVKQKDVIKQIKIKDTVGEKNLKVLSYNKETDQSTFKPITAAAKMGENKRLVKITDLSTGKFIKCTPEHKVYTKNRGYVEAINLKDTDILLII